MSLVNKDILLESSTISLEMQVIRDYLRMSKETFDTLLKKA